MTEPEQQKPVPQFPHYPPGTTVASIQTAGQLAKLVNRLAKPPGKAPKPKGKGLTSQQNVHIGKRRKKFY